MVPRLVATWVKFKGDDLEQAQVAEAAHRQSRKQTAEKQSKIGTPSHGTERTERAVVAATGAAG